MSVKPQAVLGRLLGAFVPEVAVDALFGWQNDFKGRFCAIVGLCWDAWRVDLGWKTSSFEASKIIVLKFGIELVP